MQSKLFKKLNRDRIHTLPPLLIDKPWWLPKEENIRCTVQGRKFTLAYDPTQPVASFTLSPAPFMPNTRVHQGYIDSDKEPRFAVRIYSQQAKASAQQAARAALILDRFSLVFEHNNQHYFVTDWHKGKCLVDMTYAELTNIPVKKRVQFAIDLAKQLKKFGERGLVHCDIKPDHVIINEDSIYLMGLSAVLNPQKANQDLSYCPAYFDKELFTQVVHNADSNLKHFGTHSVLYALGITLAHLFPDLFRIINKTETLDSNAPISREYFLLNNSPKLSQYRYLGQLIDTLVTEDRNARIRSIHYLIKCLEWYDKQLLMTENIHRIFVSPAAPLPQHQNLDPTQTATQSSAPASSLSPNLGLGHVQ